MMVGKSIIYAILGFMLVAQTCSATYIGLSLSVSVPDVVASDGFQVNVTVVNSGDEDAHDVQLTLGLPAGFNSTPQQVGNLPPNLPYTTTFDVAAGGSIVPGTYPFVVKTHYADANAYPFSTVSPNFIRYRQSTPAKMRLVVQDVNVSASGDDERELKVDLMNMDDKPHTVSVRLYLPDEVKSSSYVKSLDMAPQDAQTVVFPVKSFGALAGSSYATFASMEYDDGGLHYSALGGGLVRILSKVESDSSMPSWAPLALLAALVALFIVSQFRKGKGEGKG
jgi:hypothetical protein